MTRLRLFGIPPGLGVGAYFQYTFPTASAEFWDESDAVDLVAGNISAMPSQGRQYWRRRLVPHLVSIDVDERLPTAPPTGWRIYPLKLTHAAARGATNATSYLTLLLPEALTKAAALQHRLPLQSWTPMSESVDSVQWAPPAAAEEPPADTSDRVPRVHWQGEDVLPWGLFPSSALDVTVRVPCVYNSPEGWGCRLLQLDEQADLWDVPLLHQKWAARGGWSRLLASFTATTPGKILVLRGNYLLASCMRGGMGLPRLPRVLGSRRPLYQSPLLLRGVSAKGSGLR